MHFTLRQLEYFVAVGESGTIKFAAARMHVSQSAVSIALSQLETEIGVRLLTRHPAKGLTLTAEGEHFLREAKTLLRAADRLRSTSLKISSKAAVSLDIGCLLTQYHLVVPEVQKRISDQFENADVRFIAGDQAALVEKLRRGDVALALVWGLGMTNEFRYRGITRLPPFVFLADDHALARRSKVRLVELADEPFFLFDRPLSRDYFLSLFRTYGVEPRIAGCFEQMEVIRSLVARGHGYSITSVPPVNRMTPDGKPVAYVEIEGRHQELGLGVASLGRLEDIPLGEFFFQLCRDLILKYYMKAPALQT